MKGSFMVVSLGLGGTALLAVVVAAVARRSFLGRIESLRRSLEKAPKALATRADLPSEVLTLARRLGACDDGVGRLVRLTQSGEMWLRPGSKPLAFKAEQAIAAGEVGFLWRAWLIMTAGVSMQVIDYTVGGKAGLECRLLGALPIIRMSDSDTMFRGEAMRYLAELMWNPDALLLNRQLDWRVINARTLVVATGGGTRRCQVRLILDDAGDLIGIEADDRPRQDGRIVSNCPWFGRGGDYRTIGGRRIPTQAEVGWLLNGIEFIYWRGRVDSWSLKV
ncbi:DUF6544 family protein [Edaphobacter aggregans]|uniref:DUF6544 family protein n=1 Tax=Edaphobacter aggregans TaxID=570835 RepID=UPI000550A3DD|nr:DUF6544 family protein [Edaphobacter aggregans]